MKSHNLLQDISHRIMYRTYDRNLGSYLKLSGQVVMRGGGHNLPPLVEVGLTDLPKPGRQMLILPTHLLRPYMISVQVKIHSELNNSYFVSISNFRVVCI